jgi:hypothetical protein
LTEAADRCGPVTLRGPAAPAGVHA